MQNVANQISLKNKAYGQAQSGQKSYWYLPMEAIFRANLPAPYLICEFVDQSFVRGCPVPTLAPPSQGYGAKCWLIAIAVLAIGCIAKGWIQRE